ncbi:MAG: RdgB/HAM1 family non-canonical purine NTP pyrophosphatase [Myxococcota bacterium]|nr:RdgB/HAM1 family non-canonical purine NTP pyrophosphatase [Myxococcota bacterium]
MSLIRVATGNPGKLREFREILSPLGYDVQGLEDFPGITIVEDGETFEANALIKANTIMNQTGSPAIADDSGLVVDALGGRPGVHSARYAGVDGPEQDAANRNLLLKELSGIPDPERSARFVCALAYCVPQQEPLIFRGTFEGAIGYEERGENGFGYDSIFLVQNDHRTSAELSPKEKNAISHRGEALAQFIDYIKAQ